MFRTAGLLAAVLCGVALAGCNNAASSVMPGKLFGSFVMSPEAAGAESMRVYACRQVGFSASVCAGGDVTAGDINRWVNFSNQQGQAGYHFYQITQFNVGGKPTNYWIYEKP